MSNPIITSLSFSNIKNSIKKIETFFSANLDQKITKSDNNEYLTNTNSNYYTNISISKMAFIPDRNVGKVKVTMDKYLSKYADAWKELADK